MNNLRHSIGYQALSGRQFGKLGRIVVEFKHATSNRVSRGVIAVNDQQNQVAQIFYRLYIFDGG